MKNRKIIMGLGMIAVMTAVATGCSQKNAATVGTEGTTTVAESTMSEEEKKLSDYKTYGMQKDPVKGIVELVKNYQYAKVNADARRMYNVFGRSDEDGLSDLQTKLSEEAKVYEEFDDTVTYVTRGYEANSYVVFISSNVKFRDIDTKAPMLTWAYVMESPKDAFYMVENDKMTEDEKKYVDEVSRSEAAIKHVTWFFKISQDVIFGSPHARPAMIVSISPSTILILPSAATAPLYRHAAASASTTTIIGGLSLYLFAKYPTIAPASEPTPA